VVSSQSRAMSSEGRGVNLQGKGKRVTAGESGERVLSHGTSAPHNVTKIHHTLLRRNSNRKVESRGNVWGGGRGVGTQRSNRRPKEWDLG